MESGEAKAVALLLLEKVCGLSVTEALMDNGLEEKNYEQVMEKARRVAKGEPVQYVLKTAEFCGMEMKVEPGVLIPRKETEELVKWVLEELRVRSQESGGRILDVGTGSGCIAVALAKNLKDAKVEAWDVSETALRIARENVERNGVKVKIRRMDVLEKGLQQSCCVQERGEEEEKRKGEEKEREGLDVVISNPPYVCEEEEVEMEENVVGYEPRVALFVPDEDPLVFYRAIGWLGMKVLKKEGLLFFEINRRFGKEMVELLQGMGYVEVEVRKDMFGNDRMVKAIKR